LNVITFFVQKTSIPLSSRCP